MLAARNMPSGPEPGEAGYDAIAAGIAAATYELDRLKNHRED